MTTHVFIGAGPANLHLALKIRKADPNAQIIIIDKRLNVQKKRIKSKNGRANIFRFERDEVTDKLIEEGVDQSALLALMHQRPFSVLQGFQQGDDNVFSKKPFSQIQIRDLQQVLLDTLYQQKGDTRLISKDIDMSEPIALTQIIRLMQKQGVDYSKIHIYSATGALKDDPKRDAIIYPDRLKYSFPNATDDLAAMPVVPLHGTTTFFIKEKEKQLISCEALRENQCSLDSTLWQDALNPFGWTLVRPPRIRVFYANDILYIGAEIPAAMMQQDSQTYHKTIAKYTRTIAQLIFPNLPNIKDLHANPFLRSRFQTSRGQCGQVIRSPKVELGEKKIDITVFNHGDSRYLPHYQTGSGFVTAFKHNQLYAEIYQHQDFASLFQWAKSNHHIDPKLDRLHLEQEYKRLTKTEDEQLILTAFQHKLYLNLTRDSIEENKEKVGRYFNALHNQTLSVLKNYFTEFKTYFRKAHPEISEQLFEGLDERLAIIVMLKFGHVSFLRNILPRLINYDINLLTDEQVRHLRTVYLEDLTRNLNFVLARKLSKFMLSKEAVTIIIQQNFEKIVAWYNQTHAVPYQFNQFSKDEYVIVFMEMLNRSEGNFKFLSQSLSLFSLKNSSSFTNEDLLNLKKEMTQSYIHHYVSSNYFIRVAAELNEQIKAGAAFIRPFFSHSLNSTNKQTQLALALTQDTHLIRQLLRQLNLPYISKVEDQHALGMKLAQTLMEDKNRPKHVSANDPFMGNMKNVLQCPKDELLNKLISIRTQFIAKKELHRCAFLSFFKSQHSEVIHGFVHELTTLTAKKSKVEEKELQFLTFQLFMRFYNTLTEGHSIRTLAVLRESINQQFADTGSPMSLRLGQNE